MKMKQLNLTKKTIILTAAGTVAAQATLAQAAGKQGPGGGKLEAIAKPDQANELRLDQIGTPLDILVPPTADFMMDFDSEEFCGSKTGYCSEDGMDMGMPGMDGSGMYMGMPDIDMPDMDIPDMELRSARIGEELPERDGPIAEGPSDIGPDGPPLIMPIDNPPPPAGGGGKMAHEDPTTMPMAWANNGIVYAGDVEDFAAIEGIQPKVDFVVSGIRNDQEIDLFLVYNKRKAEEGEVAPFQSGQGAGGLGVPLDLGDGLQIIAGIRLNPVQPIPGMEPLMDEKLGNTINHLRSAVISVSLKQLSEGVRNGALPRDIYFQAIAFPAGSLDFAQAQFSEVDHYIIDVPKPEEGHHGSKAEAYGESRSGQGGAASGGGKGK